ncbi:MAG: hypothetical protein H0V84_01965 [Actinobacteria bacterium]|nr:hypothetical protein [Actinomycetota bacterium]
MARPVAGGRTTTPSARRANGEMRASRPKYTEKASPFSSQSRRPNVVIPRQVTAL